jgi:hypothetical protein
MAIPATVSANTLSTEQRQRHPKRQRCPIITTLTIITPTTNQHRLIRRQLIRTVTTEELDAEALESFRP